jgi:hypothetical protein
MDSFQRTTRRYIPEDIPRVITSKPVLSNECEGSFPLVNRPGHEAARLGMPGTIHPVSIRLHGVVHY